MILLRCVAELGQGSSPRLSSLYNVSLPVELVATGQFSNPISLVPHAAIEVAHRHEMINNAQRAA